MIISKCPLRISIAGGSTDLQSYLDIYNDGRVITFTPNLYTYITLKPSNTKYYRIVYSSIENCIEVDDIKNDIAREVIKHFNIPPVEIIFTSDIPSTGSGLASSSSYLIAMINAVLAYKGMAITPDELAKLALYLEHKFNPLTGYQDLYGCVFSGFKRLRFDKNGLLDIKHYDTDIFNAYSMYLVPTGITRSSTHILATLDFSKIHKLLDSVSAIDTHLSYNHFDDVCMEINNGWKAKKDTSTHITSGPIEALDSKLKKTTIARRLIGAGAGGYFLAITKLNTKPVQNAIPISIGSGYSVIDF